MSLNPYLYFDGSNAGPRTGGLGQEDPARRARLRGRVLEGCDAMPGQYKKPQSFCVMLRPKEAAEAERIFSALAEGGAVEIPIAETFWALRFGKVVDRFGIPWLVNCEKPAA